MTRTREREQDRLKVRRMTWDPTFSPRAVFWWWAITPSRRAWSFLPVDKWAIRVPWRSLIQSCSGPYQADCQIFPWGRTERSVGVCYWDHRAGWRYQTWAWSISGWAGIRQPQNGNAIEVYQYILSDRGWIKEDHHLMACCSQGQHCTVLISSDERRRPI